jgi:hypothetical protein
MTAHLRDPRSDSFRSVCRTVLKLGDIRWACTGGSTPAELGVDCPYCLAGKRAPGAPPERPTRYAVDTIHNYDNLAGAMFDRDEDGFRLVASHVFLNRLVLIWERAPAPRKPSKRVRK